MVFAETLGSILTLAVFVLLGSLAAKHLWLKHWEQSANGTVVDATDALIALGLIVVSFLKLMKLNWVATVSTVATFSLTAMSGISVYASIGYSSMVLAILGYMFPSFLRRVNRPIQETSPEQSTSSDT